MKKVFVVIEQIYYSNGLEVEAALNAYTTREKAEASVKRIQKENEKLELDGSFTDYTIKELNLL